MAQATAGFTASVVITEPKSSVGAGVSKINPSNAPSNATNPERFFITSEELVSGQIAISNLVSFKLMGESLRNSRIQATTAELTLNKGKIPFIIKDIPPAKTCYTITSLEGLPEEQILNVAGSVLFPTLQEPGLYSGTTPLEIIIDYN